MSVQFRTKHLLAALGAGALAALCLPRAVACLLGAGVLSFTALALYRFLSCDLTKKEN